MDLRISDIHEYINTSTLNNYNDIYNSLREIYEIDSDYKDYVLQKIIKNYLEESNKKKKIIQSRKHKLKQLKKLELPEQRSPEWYELRKKILTASSLGSAIDKCHFQSRDELILSKIEEKPFEPNPITEWGVKYEEVAIMFYEELHNVKVLDFGLIPHPELSIFGASPDGICDDTGNDEFVARMVEIKCPPKRKFTKTVPHHYWMQVQGQLEVCDLDECDFFQVKLEEYDSFEDYSNDKFINDDIIVPGRTNLNYPKGVVITCKEGEQLSYIYSKLNQTNEELMKWIQENEKENDTIFEIKWWRITRYENTLVTRDRQWWNEQLENILKFYEDLVIYKEKPDELLQLKGRIDQSKKKKKKYTDQELTNFQLISDDEDNNE